MLFKYFTQLNLNNEICKFPHVRRGLITMADFNSLKRSRRDPRTLEDPKSDLNHQTDLDHQQCYTWMTGSAVMAVIT